VCVCVGWVYASAQTFALLDVVTGEIWVESIFEAFHVSVS